MTRIYDALLKADLEREAADGPRIATPAAAETVERDGGPSVILDMMREQAVERTWKPCLDAIPALLDQGEVVEQFRGLRSHLAQARHEAPLKTILISSGMSGEGKSFIALNLAVSLARSSNNRVVLIDGDLRRPTLHHWLGADRGPGLSEHLEGLAESFEILQHDEVRDSGKGLMGGLANLTFIASGTCKDHSSELINNRRLESLITLLSQRFDWILLDSPPVLAVPDAVDLARVADGVLLIAREAKTPYPVVQRAQAALPRSRLLGVVLNAARGAQLKKYHYSFYTSAYYGKTVPSKSEELRS